MSAVFFNERLQRLLVKVASFLHCYKLLSRAMIFGTNQSMTDPRYWLAETTLGFTICENTVYFV